MKRKSLILVLIALFCLFFVGVNKVSAVDEQTSTISFANTNERTEYTASVQVWEKDSVIFTNRKATSTTDVGNYSNPVRLYKDSTVTIEMASSSLKITSVSFLAAGDSKYKTAIKTSLENAGYTVTTSDSTYTITTEQVDSVEFSLSAQGRLSSITVKYVSTGPQEDPVYTALKEEVKHFYNHGEYEKATSIKINKDAILEDVGSHFHNPTLYNKADNVILDRTTHYCGDYLYFDNGVGFGTNGGKLTEFKWDFETATKVNEKTTYLPGMESYFVTLHDFLNDATLASGWTVDNGVYTNIGDAVINAAIAFTAPGWISIDENYTDYQKVTVKVDENGHLNISLWVSSTNRGIVTTTPEGEYCLFSEAVIFDPNLEVVEAAVQKLRDLTEEEKTISMNTKLPSNDGDVQIVWSGEGVNNNVLTYIDTYQENTPVELTATLTLGKQTKIITVSWYHAVKQQESGEVIDVEYDLVTKFSSFGWDSSYKAREISADKLDESLPSATIKFSTANKQSGTITDRPVVRTNSSTEYVTIQIEEGRISNATFNFKQWGTKTLQDIHIEYYDGVNWVTCSTSITNPSVGTLSSNVEIPVGVTQVRLAIKHSTSKVQLGISSIELTIVK